MTRSAAGLLSCAAALALVMVSPGVQGQQKPPAARAAASSPKVAAAPAAANYAQRFAGLCAACHGANGRSDVPLTPVLAGQPSLYAITQLFLFREGRRSDPAMTAVAKTMTDDDMRGFADYIGTLPPVAAPAPAPPDAGRMAKGRVLAEQHKCTFCHGADLGGGQQVPRIGGQHEAYLKESLRGFHAGTRPGYTQAMTAAVSQIPVADLDTLAYFAARFTGPAAAPAAR
ncbi:c-type cytochrome [Ramlibacter sp. PS3R-8]|uniref:c-type cytochrome n=1 Tax=Ramlibacter sp. PS3R-8 TaxID=3133437 RepID=UPI0030A5E0BE